MKADEDRGLRAVARVRGVREGDSRRGVAAQAAQCRRAEEQLAATLAHPPTAHAGSVRDFVTSANAGTQWAHDVGLRRGAVETAHVLLAHATDQWRSDRSRLAAVEALLQRRAEARAAERARTEARELDDIAAIGWSRNHLVSPTDTDPLGSPA